MLLSCLRNKIRNRVQFLLILLPLFKLHFALNLKTTLQVHKQDRPRIRKDGISGRMRASLCVPGSMTVEAALVLPWLIIGLAAVLFLFSAVRVRVDVQGAMKAAGEKWVETDLAASAVLVGGWTREELEANGADLSPMTGDISLMGTWLTDDELSLRVSYRLGVPWISEDLLSFRTVQRTEFRRWIGSGELLAGESAEPVHYVYVTPYGTVYHESSSCPYLALTIQCVSREEAALLRSDNGARYYPCESCGFRYETDMVYITEYGNRYHTDRHCRNLKRQVEHVPLDEAGGLPPCSKCGGTHHE